MKKIQSKLLTSLWIGFFILVFSSQSCLAQEINGVNLEILQGTLNGLMTQQQVNQSSNPKLADRTNVSESVDPVSGALMVKQADISLPGKDGLDLTIGRIYNSAQAEIGTKRVTVESSSSSWTETDYGWIINMMRYYSATGYWSSVRVGPISTEADAWATYNAYCDLDITDGFYVVQEPVYTQTITYYTNYSITTTTFPQKYNYNRARYDLGTGWSLAFPSVQIENEQGNKYIYYHDGIGASYRVVFTGDTTDSNLENYQGKDVLFDHDSGTYSNGQMTSAYKFVGSDKRVTYFGSDGRLLGIKDRFDNEIKFTHVNRTVYTSSSLARGTTYPYISTIIDSIGRTVNFEYENSINNPTGFDGDTITITVHDPHNTKDLSVTYIKNRTEITATDSNGNLIERFYEPQLLYVQDPRGLWTQYVDYDQITGVQSQLKFLYDSKNLSQLTAANISYLLGEIIYPNTASFYTYEKTTHNLGPDGATEAYRTTSRYDKDWKYTTSWNLVGDYNHVDYTYSGDYTGYPSYASEECVPESYNFWSQANHSNGITQKTAFNGKKQQIYIETTASNNEKTRITNEEFDTAFKYKPTKTRTDQYAADGTIAHTLYAGQTYNTWGGLESQTRPLTAAQYNNSTTKARNTVTYQYDPTYKFITQKQQYQNDSTLLTESYSYNTLGRILSYTNAKGETTNYSYAADPTDPQILIIESSITTDNPNPTKTMKKFGDSANYAFPTVTEEYYTDENGVYNKSTTTRTYDLLLGLVASETNNQGRTTSYVYDNIGRILSITLPDHTSLDGKNYSVIQEFGYFENGTMQGVINYFAANMPYYTDSVKDFSDPENQGLASTIIYAVTYFVDTAQSTAYINQPKLSAYDGYGNLLQEETYDNCQGADQWIVKSHNVYDSLKRPVKYTDAQNNSLTYTYDAWGNMSETTDPFNNLYKSEYDLVNRKTTSFFVAGDNLASYRANPESNTLKENVVENYQDQWGQTIERRVYPNWPSTSGYLSESYGYDLAGNQISFIDAKNNHNENGSTRAYQYDSLNRIIQVKDALNQLTEVTYGVLGGITGISLKENAASQPVTLYGKEYNEIGKLSAKTDPTANKTTYKYNDLGFNSAMTDRNDSTFSYTYDELNNILSDRALQTGDTHSEEFTYLRTSLLGVDRVSQYADDNLIGSIFYGYNQAARVTEKYMNYAGTGYYSDLINQYDKADRLTASSIQTASGGLFNTNYVYDKTRLQKVQTNGSTAADASGQAYATYEYYPDGKVKKITYPVLNGGSLLTTSYVYDKLNRLQTITNAKDTTVISEYSYSYDANGNVESISDGTDTTSFVYDKLNRLTETHKPGGDIVKYSYDRHGNRQTIEGSIAGIDQEDAEYTFDLRNRLTSVTKDSDTTNISYGADGLRYAKMTGTDTVQYHYNLSGKVIAESDGTGAVTANYVWGPDRTLVKKDGSGEYYYLYDGHGDVVQIVDSSGNIVNNYKYDEWGNILDQTEIIGNPFKYCGEIYDEDTGLYYLRARYYDPTNGRFINEDSFEGTVSNPLTLNVYTYVNNNPLNYIDPTGNISWRQMSTLLSGTASGLIGISNLQSLFSMETIQGILQFVGGIMNGQIGLKDIAGSVGAAFKEPFVYLAEHSSHVWKGKPTDQQVYEYGQNMGTVLQMVAGTFLGGGALGVKAAETIAKVCPKLVKAVEKVAEASKGAGNKSPVIIGETMKRVEMEAAKHPGAKILNDMPDYSNMGLKDYQVTSKMMEYNRTWILEQMRSGRPIIDIGKDINRTNPSIFYQMEQSMIRNYQKLHPEWNQYYGK